MTISPPDQPPPVVNPAKEPDNQSWPGLVKAAAGLGVSLDGTAQERLSAYQTLLVQRNSQFNLTAIRESEAMERRLFLDAIVMVPLLDATIRARQITSPSLIDVGSGAGFPGLVLKIVRPDLDVVLLDATAKKVRFLDEAIAMTGLTGIRALHGRAEEVARDDEYREGFNLATARAVASLPVLLELTTPFLDVGGVAILPKGQNIDVELQQGTRAARLLGARIMSSGSSPLGETRLVLVEKRTLTPPSYPRRTGLPSQAPLGVPR